jgi:predicted nucleotidyltransferase
MGEALPLTAQRILETLNAHSHALHALGVRKIGLFGSYRRGESSQASDIDLLVTLARESFDDYMNVKLYLEDVFRQPVDLVMEDSLKPRLRPHILAEVVYAEGL